VISKISSLRLNYFDNCFAKWLCLVSIRIQFCVGLFLVDSHSLAVDTEG